MKNQYITTITVLCYLKCEKIWVIVLQNSKNYHLHWIKNRASIIFKYIICIFFQFWTRFMLFLLHYFQKVQLLVVKKIWNDFCFIVLMRPWAWKMCFRFLKSYFKLEILMFWSFVVSSLVYMFNQKAYFLMKKHQQWNLGQPLVDKLLTWQNNKGKFHH